MKVAFRDIKKIRNIFERVYEQNKQDTLASLVEVLRSTQSKVEEERNDLIHGFYQLCATSI